jgi:hypothetical protein
MDQTIAELQLEMIEDMLLQRETLEAQIERATDSDFRADLREKLTEINKVLGEEAEEIEDPLIDKWEEELARGQTPDLTER